MTKKERREYVDSVRRKLDNRHRSLTFVKICYEANLSLGWINGFSQKVYGNPHLRLVTRLEAYLDKEAARSE